MARRFGKLIPCLSHNEQWEKENEGHDGGPSPRVKQMRDQSAMGWKKGGIGLAWRPWSEVAKLGRRIQRKRPRTGVVVMGPVLNTNHPFTSVQISSMRMAFVVSFYRAV
jgi:hypothetical protein